MKVEHRHVLVLCPPHESRHDRASVTLALVGRIGDHPLDVPAQGGSRAWQWQSWRPVDKAARGKAPGRWLVVNHPTEEIDTQPGLELRAPQGSPFVVDGTANGRVHVLAEAENFGDVRGDRDPGREVHGRYRMCGASGAASPLSAIIATLSVLMKKPNSS